MLLKFSHAVDAMNAKFGQLANVLILLACIVSASNALLRYSLDISDNWPLELQWYLFGAAVMLGASYTLAQNGHVRVDIIYGNVSDRARLWIDIFGLLLFLLPACTLFAWLSWKTCSCPRGTSSNTPAILAAYRATPSNSCCHWASAYWSCKACRNW